MIQTWLKKICLLFLITLIAFRLSFPVAILADTPTATDTPAPTPTTTVDQTNVNNSATVNNGTTSDANTGSNTVSDTTPTPTDTPSVTPTPTTDPSVTPTDTPTPTPDPSLTPDPTATDSSSVTASNSADVTNTTSSTGNTGQNTVTTTGSSDSSSSADVSPTPTPTPQITVTTGDAVSIVAGSNTINTTSVNSDTTDQTINIFGDSTGDIDLSTLFQLVSNIITSDNNNNPIINVQVTGVNNYAYLSNDVVSTANTGNNTANTNSGTVVVSTGNADSVVSLVNKVNLTVVNSSLHLVTINIFGHLSGNIILPDIQPLQSTTCASCGVTFNTQNQATVNNDVTSTANTGQNTVTASGGATLTTGNAESDVNTVNVVNQTALNMIFEYLFVNDFGQWNGNFLGWDNFAPSSGGNTLALTSGEPNNSGGTPSGNISDTSINNTAIVNNTITSLANTGGNTVNGQESTVTTGNAYSAISLINFVNSNFLKSLGFFGFINIFGQWDGNLGGASAFVTPTPTPGPSQDTSTAFVQENGGAVSVENSNNVGAFVLPGDTVTFFLKVKNTGLGKVYGAKLALNLIHNGQQVGTTTFDLGDIPVSRGVKISTGLVLSKNAPAGDYTAQAIVTGTTGPSDTGVSGEADSTFSIFGTNIVAENNSTPIPVPHVLHHAVLGAHTNKPTPESDTLLLILLGLSVGGYLTIKGARNRKLLQEIWQNSSSFKQKLLTVRILLL